MAKRYGPEHGDRIGIRAARSPLEERGGVVAKGVELSD